MASFNTNENELRAELKGLFQMVIKKCELEKNGNASIHNNVKCNLCLQSDFAEYRYKCLICADYNLCGDCFEKKAINREHELNHPVVRFETPGELFNLKFDDHEINLFNFIRMFKDSKHNGLQCDGCHMNPIRGLRFKCDMCNEFDFCLDCYMDKRNTAKHFYSNHTLIAIGKNLSMDIDPKNIDFLKCLGSGAFGKVYKAILRPLNKVVACKIIQINQMNQGMDPSVLQDSYLQELNAYKELKGVNILKMFGHCTEKMNATNNLMIITEYMSKGSLTNLLNTERDLTYRRRLQISSDIACGMARIHEHGFIHRDIRPDNILIAEDYTAKIGDMGIAKLIENNKNTLIGCRPYMPPEFYTGKYDQKLDVFTFGLTLNELYGGTHHFNHPIRLNIKAPVSLRLISQCVDHEPARRPNSNQIKKTIKLYRRVIDESFQKYYPNYKDFTQNRKNDIFVKLYTHLEKIDV